MFRKVREFFVDEDAVASPSDKAVLILVAIALALAVYAVANMGGI